MVLYKYIVSNSENESRLIENRIFNLINFNDNITNRYSEILKHPVENKYALIIEPRFIQHFTEDEINNSTYLTEDWFQ